ncbi:MAG: YkgJ family cysteine cluster protein [Candidatus Wallbacteria bacterium]|nr:YkgJ family cysteine cluster protein [Candidatus Wallbacteria bacterium]
MPFKCRCPHCSSEFHIFNFRETDFLCPVCRKKILSRKFDREKVKQLPCRNCGACCRFVPELTASDLARFRKKFPEPDEYLYEKKGKLYFYLLDENSQRRLSSTKLAGCYCIFFDRRTGFCAIHTFKPAQCTALEASFACRGEQKPEVDFSKI